MSNVEDSQGSANLETEAKMVIRVLLAVMLVLFISMIPLKLDTDDLFLMDAPPRMTTRRPQHRPSRRRKQEYLKSLERPLRRRMNHTPDISWLRHKKLRRVYDISWEPKPLQHRPLTSRIVSVLEESLSIPKPRIRYTAGRVWKTPRAHGEQIGPRKITYCQGDFRKTQGQCQKVIFWHIQNKGIKNWITPSIGPQSGLFKARSMLSPYPVNP